MIIESNYRKEWVIIIDGEVGMVRELEGFLFCYRLEWCFVIGWYVLCDCCLNFSRWRVI